MQCISNNRLAPSFYMSGKEKSIFKTLRISFILGDFSKSSRAKHNPLGCVTGSLLKANLPQANDYIWMFKHIWAWSKIFRCAGQQPFLSHVALASLAEGARAPADPAAVLALWVRPWRVEWAELDFKSLLQMSLLHPGPVHSPIAIKLTLVSIVHASVSMGWPWVLQ